MQPLQSVGMREFRAKLHFYTRNNADPIAITSHGEPVGYYIPTRSTPQEQAHVTLLEAVNKLTALLDAAGVDADQIVADFQAVKQANR